MHLLWRHSSVNWPDPTIFLCRKLRKGCAISYVKFQRDPPSNSAAISEKKAHGKCINPHARARVNLSTHSTRHTPPTSSFFLERRSLKALSIPIYSTWRFNTNLIHWVGRQSGVYKFNYYEIWLPKKALWGKVIQKLRNMFKLTIKRGTNGKTIMWALRISENDNYRSGSHYDWVTCFAKQNTMNKTKYPILNIVMVVIFTRGYLHWKVSEYFFLVGFQKFWSENFSMLCSYGRFISCLGIMPLKNI